MGISEEIYLGQGNQDLAHIKKKNQLETLFARMAGTLTSLTFSAGY